MRDHCLLPCLGAWRSSATDNVLTSRSSLGQVGVPPHQRHPQIPSFAQTGMPKYDPFSKPLLLIITFQEMTMKHLIYTQKVPFLCTESACVVFPSFEICPGRFFVCGKKCCKYFGPGVSRNQRFNNINAMK